MPTIRVHLRSSDSVDYEHTATFKDLEELAITEEVSKRSPKLLCTKLIQLQDQLSVENSSPPIPQMEASVQIINDTVHTTPTVIAKKDLSNSLRESHTRTAREKIAVYREENSAPKTGKHIVALGRDLHPHRGFDLDTHRDGWFPKVKEREPVVTTHTENAQASCAMEGPNNTQLIQQLQSIFDRRASLLRQLDDLQHEEARVLASLSSETLGGPIMSSSPPRSRPTKRNVSVSRLPRLIPSKINRKPRPVSAPPISTPSSTRFRAFSTMERKPLGDKTFTVFKDDHSVV
jgi:hypothetical protein